MTRVSSDNIGASTQAPDWQGDWCLAWALSSERDSGVPGREFSSSRQLSSLVSPLESRRCCWGCCSSKTSSRAPSCCCREICHDFALFPPLFCESPVPERRGALAGTDLRRRPMSAFNSTVLGNPWLQWSDQKVSDFQKHQQLTFYACEGGPRIC